MMFYLLDKSPDGGEEVLVYGADDMAEVFTDRQRADLAAGEAVIHHWPLANHSHIIIDMRVAARARF